MKVSLHHIAHADESSNHSASAGMWVRCTACGCAAVAIASVMHLWGPLVGVARLQSRWDFIGVPPLQMQQMSWKEMTVSAGFTAVHVAVAWALAVCAAPLAPSLLLRFALFVGHSAVLMMFGSVELYQQLSDWTQCLPTASGCDMRPSTSLFAAERAYLFVPSLCLSASVAVSSLLSLAMHEVDD